MLALGDALSVALLRQKGFSERDFHTFHPGGKLGAALKRVTELIHHEEMPLCIKTTPFSEAIETINQGGVGCCGVVEDEILCGIITDGDIRRAFNARLEVKAAADIMTENPRTIRDYCLAVDVLSLLCEHMILALFIVDSANRPIGLIHVHDCLEIGVV